MFGVRAFMAHRQKAPGEISPADFTSWPSDYIATERFIDAYDNPTRARPISITATAAECKWDCLTGKCGLCPAVRVKLDSGDRVNPGDAVDLI